MFTSPKERRLRYIGQCLKVSTSRTTYWEVLTQNSPDEKREKEQGGEQRVPESLQSPHTHCTLSTAKLPFRRPEKASHLPKTEHSFLMRKQPSPPIVSVSLPQAEECASHHRVACYSCSCRCGPMAIFYHNLQKEIKIQRIKGGQMSTLGMHSCCCP